MGRVKMRSPLAESLNCRYPLQMRASPPILSALALLLGACSTTSTVETESTSCFEPCLAVDAEVDLSEQLGVVTDITLALDVSREVLVEYVDGVLALGLVAAALVDGTTPALPPGFSYEGDGVYSVDVGNGAVAKVQFFWPIDGVHPQLGTPITWDVFDTDNYFKGLSVNAGIDASLSGVDSYVELQADEVGPGAQLLGLGPSSQSPFRVDVEDMTDALKRTASAARVSINPDAFGAVAELDIDSGVVTVADIEEDALELSVDTLAGVQTDTSQILSLQSADLSLIAQGAAYLGEFQFSSVSVEFSFEGRIRFDASADAEVRLGCPGTELGFPDEARVNEMAR
jgi:hypothetical protein